MLRFCGQCGYSLTSAALHVGRCPQCGAPLEASGDVPAAADVISSADDPTRPAADAIPAPAVPDVADTRTAGTDHTPAQPSVANDWLDAPDGRATALRPAQPSRPQPRQQARWALAALLIVPLVLAATSVLVLSQTGALATVQLPFASPHSGPTASGTAGRSAGGTTPTTGTASHSPTQTPAAGGTPSPTGSPSPTTTVTPSPTDTPVSASLSVSPPMINITLCVAAHTSFKVANTGGTTMQWGAVSSPDGYIFTPGSGTVAAGGYQIVNVSQISGPGTVTVTAPNAGNSPQQITITCKLP